MREKQPIRWLIGALCVVVLVAAVIVALILDSRSPDPIFGIFKPQPDTSEQDNSTPSDNTDASVPDSDASTQDPDTSTDDPDAPTDEALPPPTDLPPSVVIPPAKDPVTGEPTGIVFPCTVPGYGLVIEKMAPYDGMFVEDGTNTPLQGVAMLMVKNQGDFPLEYTQIAVEFGQETLLFDISALPVGERLVVQERDGKPLPAAQPTAATALVVQRAKLDMSEDKVQVTDNGDNTLTIRNLTDEAIPTVRVFYKYYMKDEDIFVGGIAFTVRITRLGAGGSVTIQPTHYTSETGRVVMVLTYDTEV